MGTRPHSIVKKTFNVVLQEQEVVSGDTATFNSTIEKKRASGGTRTGSGKSHGEETCC